MANESKTTFWGRFPSIPNCGSHPSGLPKLDPILEWSPPYILGTLCVTHQINFVVDNDPNKLLCQKLKQNNKSDINFDI